MVSVVLRGSRENRAQVVRRLATSQPGRTRGMEVLESALASGSENSLSSAEEDSPIGAIHRFRTTTLELQTSISMPNSVSPSPPDLRAKSPDIERVLSLESAMKENPDAKVWQFVRNSENKSSLQRKNTRKGGARTGVRDQLEPEVSLAMTDFNPTEAIAALVKKRANETQDFLRHLDNHLATTMSQENYQAMRIELGKCNAMLQCADHLAGVYQAKGWGSDLLDLLPCPADIVAATSAVEFDSLESP